MWHDFVMKTSQMNKMCDSEMYNQVVYYRSSLHPHSYLVLNNKPTKKESIDDDNILDVVGNNEAIKQMHDLL